MSDSARSSRYEIRAEGDALVPETETAEVGRPDVRAPKDQTPEPARIRWRRGPLFAYLAALAALAAIPVHLYWALGGTWGLPGGAATAACPGYTRPTWPSRSCWRAGRCSCSG